MSFSMFASVNTLQLNLHQVWASSSVNHFRFLVHNNPAVIASARGPGTVNWGVAKVV